MISLPHDMRDNLVEHLDEYLEAHSASPDGEAIAAYVIELLGTVAEEFKVPDADEIVLKLESSGELEATLQEVLEEEFESNEEMEYTGEEIVTLIEKACEVEWATAEDAEDEEEDDDDDPDGFFDGMGAEDEED